MVCVFHDPLTPILKKRSFRLSELDLRVTDRGLQEAAAPVVDEAAIDLRERGKKRPGSTV
jgi:hypothetical protein